jgi:hypothetical protein
VLFYGVVSSQTDEALELFLQHEQAEVFIAEVEEDEPERRRACGSSWLSSKRSETRRPACRRSQPPNNRLLELFAGIGGQGSRASLVAVFEGRPGWESALFSAPHPLDFAAQGAHSVERGGETGQWGKLRQRPTPPERGQPS